MPLDNNSSLLVWSIFFEQKSFDTAMFFQQDFYVYTCIKAIMSALERRQTTILCAKSCLPTTQTNFHFTDSVFLFPFSRFSRAGSRYETASNCGAAHMLRCCAGLGTNNSSAFNITRTVQQAGGSLSAESGREHMIYGLDIIRDNL